MPGKLIDIKETGLEVENVKNYRISRAKNSAGETLDLAVPGFLTEDDVYCPGTIIIFKGKSWEITSRRYEATEGGYLTNLSAIDEISSVIRKAPSKALCYMSMTQAEFDEFSISLDGDFTILEYMPLIKICNTETLKGGWESASVLSDLCRRIGLRLYYGVYSYQVKQVMVGSETTYWEAIQSLVAMFEPDIFIRDGVLYITDSPLQGGTVSFAAIRQFSQTEVMNYDTKVQDLWVEGGYGQWNRGREQEWMKMADEEVVTIETVSQSEEQMVMSVTLKGDVRTTDKETGKVSDTPGEYTYEAPMDEPNVDKTTRTETILLDIYGNRKALLSEHKVKYNETVGAVVLDETTEYSYDFLDEKYDRPRETRRKTYRSEWQWQVLEFPGGSRRYFKNRVQEIEHSKLYANNGNILFEFMTRKSDCLKLPASGLYQEETYIELQLADMWWVEDGQTPPNMERFVVEEEEIRYRQLTPDTYERSSTHRMPAGLRRKKGDELRGSTTQMIRGRVPRYPRSYRKSHIVVRTLGNSAVSIPMEMPAHKVSNPNIIIWGDADVIHQILSQKMATCERVVERIYTLPMDLKVDLNWPISFDSHRVGRDGLVPEMTVINGRIVSYARTKDAGGTAQTVINAEGRIQ